MLREFLTAADEVHRLQRGKTVESDFFRGFCEEGHYGGREQPSSTRQGFYCIAPSGKLLASINTTQPGKVAAMLRDALARWQEIPASERVLSQDQVDKLRQSERSEDSFPEDGLVLAEYVRDLDRRDQPDDWRRLSWNQDQVWFSKSEARSMVPESAEIGATRAVPEALIKRLAALHLVDTARGQAPPFPDEAVRQAVMRSEVTRIEGDLIRMNLQGRSMVVQRGRWATEGYGDLVDAVRGVQTQLSGRATWDQSKERFTAFDLVAVGNRWGASQFNGRHFTTSKC